MSVRTADASVLGKIPGRPDASTKVNSYSPCLLRLDRRAPARVPHVMSGKGAVMPVRRIVAWPNEACLGIRTSLTSVTAGGGVGRGSLAQALTIMSKGSP